MKRSSTVLLMGFGGSMCALVAGACEPPPKEPIRLSAVGNDLVHGSTGPEVEALTNYLKTYGYFPNEDLQSQYPAWRPIVAAGPSDANIFDANVEAAVFAFQKNFGLGQTGVLDAGTRAVMAQPRCGVPDGITRLDPSDKFAVLQYTTQGYTTPVTWALGTTQDSGMSPSSIASDIQTYGAGANSWSAYSAYTFQQTTSNEMIFMGFFHLNESGTWASTTAPSVPATSTGGVSMYFNSDYSWSASGQPTSTQLDFPSIVAHEWGHALGLSHSSDPTAVMYPTINRGVTKRNFSWDDIQGIAAVNPKWTNLGAPPSGYQTQRAAFTNRMYGYSLWALSGSTSGGFKIWEKYNSGWMLHPGGAVRIAINPGGGERNQPWVIDDQYRVWRWNLGIQNWDYIPACATDISVGLNDDVWVVGCDSKAGGYGIYKYNGDASCSGGNCWTESDGGAITISVGQRSATDTTMVPWVINSSGNYFRRTSGDPTVSGAWETLPQASAGNPTNVSIAAGYGYAFTGGWDTSSGNPNIYSWDEQAAGTQGQPPPPAERIWFWVGDIPSPFNVTPTMAPAGMFPIVVTGVAIYQMF